MEPEFNSCKICNKVIGFDSMVAHLKSHKISKAEYYQKFHPRKDKLTGEIILFKNLEFYLNNDFNEKKNLKAWLSGQPVEEQRKYCLSLIKKRVESKGLKYSPSQIELRTLMIPSVNYLDSIFPGGYYEEMSKLGLINKYKKYLTEPAFQKLTKITIDTREQRPLNFDVEIKREKLDFGDYGTDDSISGKCYVERKSVADLWGTVTQGYERFQREIVRAKESGAHLFIVVEGDIDEIYCSSVKKFTRVNAEFIFHKIRELTQKYETIQFLCVKDRVESARIITKLLSCGGYYKQYDVQLLYDLRKI